MSYQGRRVAVVIPARNEAPFVGEVIRAMPACVDSVVVVDDASTDGTGEAARAVGDSRVEILRHQANMGVGGAMVTGYRRALEVGADVIVKMDGDGQMSPDDLPALLDAVTSEGCAYAKGNRFLVGAPRAIMPRTRFMGNMALAFLTKLASGYWNIFDPQNGYTAIRSDALRQIDLDALDRGYFFENDMLVQLNIRRLRVKDVPMPARYGGEASGIRPFRVGLGFSRLLLQRFAYRVYQKYMLRDFSPIALFLLAGGALFLWGLGFGVFLWVRGRMMGMPTATGTIMLAVVPLFLGFQLLLQAIVLDIQETPR